MAEDAAAASLPTGKQSFCLSAAVPPANNEIWHLLFHPKVGIVKGAVKAGPST